MRVVYRDDRTMELILDGPRVVTVKMDEPLLRQMDSVWPKLGFKSRSEFIRFAVSLAIKIANRRIKIEDLLNSLNT